MIDLRALFAVDVETSGPSPFENQLLSVALVPFDDSLSPFEVFVDHGSIRWGKTARSYFEKYEQRWEAERKSPESAFQALCDYLSGVPGETVHLVGHNVGFDHGFLQKLARDVGASGIPKVSHRLIDTHSLLFMLSLLGELSPGATTSGGAFAELGIEVIGQDRHTALGDALATRDLMRGLVARFEALQRGISARRVG